MFSYSFITRKTEKAGILGIYIRITVQSTRSELSTKRTVSQHRWDSQHGKVKGATPEAKELNKYLEELVVSLHHHYRELVQQNKPITAETLKKAYLGITDHEKTVLGVFTEHLDQLSRRVGVDYSINTVKRYESCRVHLVQYLNEKKLQVLSFNDLTPAVIEDFEIYLKTTKGCQHNTVHKYLAILKKVVRIAVINGWTNNNPFNHFKLSFEDKTPVYLTIDELKRIEKKEFEIIRLKQVRDLFLFSCYTGLAYSDAVKLTGAHIQVDESGNKLIYVARTKTKTACTIPLLPVPLKILNAYGMKGSGALLPSISNQKMNAYLKEIADLCGITKKLTTHVARHTFATTVTLTNGVPIETVSRLLGHKNILQTHHYARVVDQKVVEDMKSLEKKL